MPPDETPQQIAGQDDIPEDITEEEAAARDEWSGVGEKPLKDHVRNDQTVDLEEGQRSGIHLGDPVDNWAGDYEARPDWVAADPNITPPYDVSHPGSREQFIANGPGRDEPTFDVHDYVESDLVAPGTDLSGYIVPSYE